jgi:3D (Asp-Asp-Asp) domain-containing protein
MLRPAGAAVLGFLRGLDRRFRFDPVRIASCAALLPTTALATLLAVGLAGGCGPRVHPAHPTSSAQTLAPSEGGGSPHEPIVTPSTEAVLPPPPPGPGRAVRVTLYHLAAQTCPDAAEVALPRCGGGSIAQVSNAFKHSAAMQGSAKLCDGRVVGVQKVSPLCFVVVAEGNPWGVTASGRPAAPFRSIAVDTKIFPMGRWYYVPELDGVALPAPSEGKKHDGCVRADDVGGAVKGELVDLFVGARSAVDAMKGKFSDTTIHLVEAEARCANAPAL